MEATTDHSPELEKITDIMIALEAWHHEQGWDNNPAAVYIVLLEKGEDEVSLGGGLTLGTHGLHPRIEIATLAQGVASGHEFGVDLVRETYAEHKPVAHILVAEGYMQSGNMDPGMSPEQAMEQAHQERMINGRERDIGDLPDAVEVRWGYAATDAGVLFLSRARGEEPVLAELAPATGKHGAMADALIKFDGAVKRIWNELPR